MKKSLVAVGVIIAVGAVWTGASWYTGSKVESEFSRVIEKSNQALAVSLPDTGIVLKVENYQRGIFSSNADVLITSADSTDNSDAIVIKTNIDHGPFPVSQVAKFNLMPKLAATHVELANNKVTEKLFKYTDGKSLINGTTVIGYGKGIDSTFDIIPLDITENGNSLKFSGAKFVFEGTADLKDIKASLTSDNTVISSDAEKESMVLKGLKFTSDITKTDYGFYTGDQALVVENVDVNNNNTAFSFKNLKVNSATSVADKNAKGSLTYSIDDLDVLGQNLGSGKMSLSMDRVSAEALGKFITDYNEAISQSLSDGSLPYVADQLAMRMLSTSLPELMKSNPQFAISPLSWKNAAGESNFDLSIDFNAWTPEELTNLGMSNKADEAVKKLFKSFDMNIKLSKPMLIEAIAQSHSIDSGKVVNAEEKKAFTEQATQELTTIEAPLTADMFSSPYEDMFLTDEQRAEKAKQKPTPWMVNSDDALTMSFKFDGNDIMVNGQKFALADFLTKMHVMTPTAEEQPEEQIDVQEEIEVPAVSEQAPAAQ